MTTPIAAVKAGFRQYARFSGRATRAEFWWWALFIAVVQIALVIIAIIIGGDVGIGLGVLFILFGLATLLPTLAAISRRLHDTGMSGWFQLMWYAILPLAGLVGIVAYLVFDWISYWALGAPPGALIMAITFLSRQGQPGENRYGPDPRAVSDEPAAYPDQNDWYTETPR